MVSSLDSDCIERTNPLLKDRTKFFKPPKLPKPGYLVKYIDPIFGRTIRRIVDDAGNVITFTQGGTGTWGADCRQHYTLDQAWSSDSKLIFLENVGGSPAQLFLDGATYLPKFGTPSGFVRGEDRWHPSVLYPNIRINIKPGGLVLEWYDVVNNVQVRSWTLPSATIGIGPGKGNPTKDGRFLALLTADKTKAYVVDMDPQPPFAPYPYKRVGPQVDLTDSGISGSPTVSSITMSAFGNYLVVAYTGDYQRVYDFHSDTLLLTPRPQPPRGGGYTGDPAKGFVYNIGHHDTGINPWDNNAEVIIGQEHSHNIGKVVDGKLMGGVTMVRLSDGLFTPLTDPTNEAYPRHISLRNTDRLGWCYVTHFNDVANKTFRDELIAVNLNGSLEMERLAHCHTNAAGCYRCEEHPVPHMNGKRVLFCSSWGRDCSPGCGSQTNRQAYILDYPEC